MKLIYLNIKQAWRNLRKNGWQTAIAVAGIVLDMVCLTFSANWWWNDTHYDSFRPEYRKLYMVQTRSDWTYSEDSRSSYHAGISYPALQEIRQCVTVADTMCAYRYEYGYTYVTEDGREIDEDVMGNALMAMPDILPLLGIEALQGNVRQALQTPGMLVVSASVARKVFGTEDAAGRRLGRKHWMRPDEMQIRRVMRENPADVVKSE